MRAPAGRVVLHGARESGHEGRTHLLIATALARLKGYALAGEPGDTAGHAYFVPANTLVGPEAEEIGITGEDDLFGGVVPHGFVATKAITHGLLAPNARAPRGWSFEFEDRVRIVVHDGYSAFSAEDARAAGAELLRRGPVRVKPVNARGGAGQRVVTDKAALDAALDQIDAAELSSFGLVLEENLEDVATYSVGQVRVGELVASYIGIQHVTRDNDAGNAYGGSDLMVVRGGFEALLAFGASEDGRLAIEQATTYDGAASACFPGLFASRRNYDVAQGIDAAGRRRSGVLEQSWRMGGASTAEVAALEAFHADPSLQAVSAQAVEIYGPGHVAPPNATVFFQGVDEEIGPILKYALVKPL